jgi:tetratricopeptide (TPR) repeat protein
MNAELQETYVSIGEKIRQLRQRAGLTQTDLVGDEYSIAYLSRIEHGYLAPSEGFLEHIATRLGLSVADMKIGIYPLKSRAKQKNQEVELLRLYNLALAEEFKEAKAGLEAMDRTELTSELLARHYFINSLIALDNQSFEIAQANLQQALSIFDAFPALPSAQLGWLHFWLGRAYFLQKRYLPALDHHRAVRQLFADNKISENEAVLKASVIYNMVLELVYTESYEQALTAYRQAPRKQILDLDRNKAANQREIAANYTQSGNLSAAKSYYLQAASTYESILEAQITLAAQDLLGEEALKKSDFNTAENLFNAALSLANELRDRLAGVNILCHLSEVYLQQNEPARGEQLVQTAWKIAENAGNKALGGRVLLQSAKVKFAQKDSENAFKLVQKAIESFESLDYTDNQLEKAYYFFATALQEDGNLSEAIKMYHKALNLKK